MKKQLLYRIAASILFLFLVRLSASAQSHEYVMKVNVPFEFQVNGKTLPAGDYVIRRDLTTPDLLRIQSPERNIWVSVHTIPHRDWEERSRPCLIFNKYGENHFLNEVRTPARSEGYVLIKSKAERRQEQVAKAEIIHAVPDTATK
jgi:hypothetical protein